MRSQRILIAEDDLSSAGILKEMLESAGYQVAAIVSSGEAAVKATAETAPEIILMDILLEGSLDGIAAAEQIASRWRTPVIFTTAYGDDSTIYRAKFSGAAGFLLKPYSERQLISTIEMALFARITAQKKEAPWPIAILKSINDCVIATDETGHITYINRAAEDLTGWNLNEASGRNFTDVFRLVPESSKSGESSLGDLTDSNVLISKSEARTPIEHNTVFIREAGNKVIGYAIVFRDITERRKAEELIRESRQRYKGLINSIDGIVWESDLERTQFSFVSKQALRIAGYPLASWTSVSGFWRKHLHPADARNVIEYEKQAIREKKNYSMEYRFLTAHGDTVWLKDNVNVVQDSSGRDCLRGVMVDITNRKVAEQKMIESEEKYRSLVEAAPDVIYSISAEGKVLTLNPAFEMLTGWTIKEWIGQSFAGMLHPDDLNIAVQRHHKILLGESQPPIELRFRTKSGDFLIGEVTSQRSVKDGEIMGSFGVIRDITKRKRAEEQLLHNAFYDPLTGLANRALFVDRLTHAIRRKKRREDSLFAVLFIDLDRFKVVNDSLGHMLGDELLIQTAERLAASLRPEDTVGRLGGDEFVILLEELKEATEAVAVAERLQKELRAPFKLKGYEAFSSASIGIALSSSHYEKAEEILRDADIAMYRAKELGKARYQIFDSAMHAHAVFLLELETDMRYALEKKQFELVYQPIHDLKKRTIHGFEALLRWNHPRRGVIAPLDFIPLAEETGLINPIGEWVLREACLQMRKWQDQFGSKAPVYIGVNLSGKQFTQPDLPETIFRILQETSLQPSSLILEITESLILHNAEMVEKMLKRLQEFQVNLLIDDFGTGYSSLGYLHRFPIDTLKIDRSFVTTMVRGDENREIVRTIITLARNLGMAVIAEGIETEEELQELISLECHLGQGYFLSLPMPSAEATAYIALNPQLEEMRR